MTCRHERLPKHEAEARVRECNGKQRRKVRAVECRKCGQWHVAGIEPSRRGAK